MKNFKKCIKKSRKVSSINFYTNSEQKIKNTYKTLLFNNPSKKFTLAKNYF